MREVVGGMSRGTQALGYEVTSDTWHDHDRIRVSIIEESQGQLGVNM